MPAPRGVRRCCSSCCNDVRTVRNIHPEDACSFLHCLPAREAPSARHAAYEAGNAASAGAHLPLEEGRGARTSTTSTQTRPRRGDSSLLLFFLERKPIHSWPILAEKASILLCPGVSTPLDEAPVAADAGAAEARARAIEDQEDGHTVKKWAAAPISTRLGQIGGLGERKHLYSLPFFIIPADRHTASCSCCCCCSCTCSSEWSEGGVPERRHLVP